MTATTSTSTPVPDPAPPADDRRAAGWGEVAGPFFAASPAGMAVVDAATGEILDANPALCAFLGRSREELTALTLRDVTPPDDGAARGDRVLETPAPLRHEQRYLRPDGTVVWGSVTVTPLPGTADGRARNVIQVEEIARRRRDGGDGGTLPLATQWLLEQVPAAVFLHPLDPDAPPTYVSPRMEAITGYRMEELLTQRDFLLPHIHREDAPAVIALSAETDRTLEPFVIDYRFQRKDGRWIWLHNVTEVIRDDAGTPLHWQGYVEDITARKQAEAELAARETQFRSAFEDAAIGMALVAPDGRFLDANPTLCRSFGIPREDLLRRTFQELTHPDDLDADLVEYRRVLAGETDGYRIDKRFLRGDGGVFWGRLTVACVRDAAGQVATFVSQIEDVSAEKRAERALGALQMRFDTLVERLPAVVAIFPLDGEHPTYVSPRAETVTGFTPAEIRAGALEIHPDDAAAVRRASEEADRTLALHAPDYRIRHRDGRWIWVHEEAEVVRDPSGEPEYWLGIYLDVTAEREAREALAEREALLQASFASAAIGMSSVDATGAVRDVNRAMLDMLGYDRGELLGRSFQDLVDPAFRAETADAFGRLVAGEIDRYRQEKRFLRKDGATVWAAVTVAAVRDADGRFLRATGQVEDITARRRAEDALRDAEALYRGLVEQVPAVVYTLPLDPDLPPIFVSPKVAALTGRTAAEVSRDRTFLREFVHPDDLAANLPIMQESDRTLQPCVMRYRIRHADGRWIWLHDSSEVVHDERSEPLCWQGVLVDITAEKALQDALAASEALFRSTFEDSAIGMAVVGPDAGILETNRVFREMLGYSPDELGGLSYHELSAPEFEEANAAAFARLAAGETDAFRLEKQYRRKDGTTFWGSLNVSAVRDADGRLVRAISQVEDITPAKEAELRYRRLVEQIPAAVFILPLEPGAPATFISPRIEEITGYRPDELTGEREFLRRYADQHDAAANDPVVAAAEAAQEPCTIRYRLQRKDGRWIWLLDSIDVVRDDAGQPLHWQGVLLDITAEKEAQQALAESEALFRTSFANAAIGMALSDRDGNLTDANPAFCRLLGRSRDELLAMDFAAITHPDDLPREWAEIARMVSGETDTYRLEKRFLRSDGEPVWTSLNASCVRGPDGGITLGIAQVEDITARKAAEAALAASEALFRSAFEDAAVGMALATSQGVLTDVNPAFCRMLGYSRDELLAMGFADFTHPDDLAREMVEVERLRSGEIDRYRLEKRYVRKDGGIVWVAFNGSCVRGPDGGVALAIGQVEDISAVKAAQQALAESEELFRTTVHQSGIATGVADAAGRFIDVNDALAAMTGYGQDELLGMTFADLGHPEDNPAEQALFRETLSGARDQWVVEKRLVRKDGSTLWAWVNVSAVRGAGGGVKRLIGQVVDVTAIREAQHALADALDRQRAANEELVRLARQRAEFLSMLAHDFRTPLTAIQGYGDLLLFDAADAASVREYARTISGSAERLNRMVNDLLAVETMEDRLGQLQLEPADVAALVVDAVAGLRGAWPGRDIGIAAEPGLPEVALDRDQAMQAVTNLVANALKYSPGSQPVTVAIRQDGPAVEIAVTDRGIGIAADRLERIFDKYARIRTKETQGIEGVGLGLPIVRAIARAHGGDAWAESEPGVGSTFRLRLPIVPPAGNGTDA